MFEEIFGFQNIAIYLIIINVLGFLAMYIDKNKAKNNSWRISEKTLLSLTALRRWNRSMGWNVFI